MTTNDAVSLHPEEVAELHGIATGLSDQGQPLGNLLSRLLRERPYRGTWF